MGQVAKDVFPNLDTLLYHNLHDYVVHHMSLTIMLGFCFGAFKAYC